MSLAWWLKSTYFSFSNPEKIPQRHKKRDTTHLLREPRRDEGHLEGIAVRVQNVEGIGIDGADHRPDPAAEAVAYCNTKGKSRTR